MIRPTRFLILDRDGVINRDRDDYVKSLEELEVFPWAPSAIAEANHSGYRVAVVSNQQAVAKGLLTLEGLRQIEQAILAEVRAAGGEIEAFRYCTHLSSEGCECRKPKPGMISDLQRTYGFEPRETFFIGDTEKDVLAARAAGCRPLLVLSGHVQREDVAGLTQQPEGVFENLGEAVRWVLELGSTSK